MSVRFVDDNERLKLLREHITVASEIVETFRVAFTDGIALNPDPSVLMLDEALNRLECAYLDTFASVESDEDAYKIDAPSPGIPS